jgi:hypothetical protein
MKREQRWTCPGWFSLAIPPGWIVKEDQDLVSFFDPNGVGALQISPARRDRPGRPDPAEARELAESFARSQGWTLGASTISAQTIGGGPGSSFEREASGDYWQVWHAVSGTRAATITYTCKTADRAQEAAVRVAIFGSFRWEKEGERSS